MRLLFSALCLVLGSAVLGCSDASPCPPCGTTAFCCLGQCLPFGATCGGSDGGISDGGISDGGGDPCAPHEDASVVARACDHDGALVYCAEKATVRCNAGFRCVEWTDGTGVRRANCLEELESSVCDPAKDVNRCDGASPVNCIADLHGPPGHWAVSDCPARWGAGATCVVGPDAWAHCDNPSFVACDPATFLNSCNGICEAGPGALPWVVQPFRCRAQEQCIANASSNGPVCIPQDAVVSSLPATNGSILLACVGADSVRVEAWGYEWVETCDTSYWGAHFVCYDPPGGHVVCIPEGAQICDPATTMPTCANDHTRRVCRPDYFYDQSPCLTNETCLGGRCCDTANPTLCF